MKQDLINDALDKSLEMGFDNTPTYNVPMKVPANIEVPSTLSEEQQKIKKNLYNTSEKLSAVMDYLINNLGNDTCDTGMLIKVSPVSDICAVAKEIGNINDKLFKYTQPQVLPKNSKFTQNNINFNNTKDDNSEDNNFTLESLDKMIKEGKVK